MAPRVKEVLRRGQVVAALQRRGDKVVCCESDDADFIVTPANGGSEFKLQVWNALVLSEKNRLREENIHVAFCDNETVYCYPHNEMLEAIARENKIVNSRSWQQHGYYFIGPPLPQWTARLLDPYCIS